MYFIFSCLLLEARRLMAACFVCVSVCLCVRMSTIGTHFFNFFRVQRPIAMKLGSKNHWPKTHMWVHFGWGRRSSRGQFGSFCNEHLAKIASSHCPTATKLGSKNHWPMTLMWVNFGWDRRLSRGHMDQYASMGHFKIDADSYYILNPYHRI